MTEKELERQISREYYKARKEIGETMQSHYERYIRTDEVKREQLKHGEITQEEYDSWLNGQKTLLSRDKELLASVDKELLNAEATSAKWINGELPYAYLDGHNDIVHNIDADINGYSYSLLDKNAVKAMSEKGDLPITTYTAGTEKHTAYVDKKARQAIQQGIIQGDSIRDVSKRVGKALGVVTEKERKATIRNTRTLMNSAHNTGAFNAMEEASENGIILDKQWLATHDERTRDSHAELDGEIRKWDEPFSNGLMFPQDFSGEPEEVYNCRCSFREITRGFYNSETGKTVMLDDEAPQEEYEEKAQEYWEEERGLNGDEDTSDESDAETVEYDFTPATTREEAEAYARDVLGTPNVDYSGLSVERCNQINEELTKLQTKYQQQPFDYIGTTRSKRSAAYVEFPTNYSKNGGEVGLKVSRYVDGTSSENFEINRNYYQSQIDYIDKCLDTGTLHGQPLSDNSRERLETAKSKYEDELKYDRWSVASGRGDADSVIDHEYGHYTCLRNTGDCSTQEVEEAYIKAKENGDIYEVSKYARTDADEFFAECFARREAGEKQPEYIEEMLRSVTGK